MSIFYINEHTTCVNYVSDYNIGFKNCQLKSGESIRIQEKDYNFLFFLISGELEVSCYKYSQLPVKEGNMIFLPKDTDFNVVAKTDVFFISHAFDKPLSYCDKSSLESLAPYCEVQYPNVNFLDIRYPLNDFLNLLSYYLNNRLRCRHLHEIKQKELFLIFRAFYTKEEIASLFAPIIGSDIDFKSKIMDSYLNVKSVQDLAEKFNCSLASFNRQFKQSFNDTPYNWMLKQKANHIKSKLQDPKIPFNKIIDEFGFSSASHFTTYCRSYFQMTPSQFRKQLQKQAKTNLNEL